MTGINKIRIGEKEYHIVPEIGKGLQLGTQLENEHVIYVNVGEAKSDNSALPETGISITPIGFSINSTKFTAFLKALGFMTA